MKSSKSTSANAKTKISWYRVGMKLPVWTLILAMMVCLGLIPSLSAQWGQPSDTADEQTFKIELKAELEGEWVEDRLKFSARTRIKDKRLARFLRKLDQEAGMQQIQSPSYNDPASDSDLYPYPEENPNPAFDSEPMYGAGLQILKSGFKLRRTQPAVPTRKVTAELYLGEDEDFPSLEALDIRLNPFKYKALEVMDSYFTTKDMQSVRIVVWIDGMVKPDEPPEYSAVWDCYLILGDSLPIQYASPGNQDWSSD